MSASSEGFANACSARYTLDSPPASPLGDVIILPLFSPDELVDDRPVKPTAANFHTVSRAGAVYGAHAYHTKIPAEAIEPHLLRYTEPGELVFDPFCGIGMTGVASAR